VRYSIFFVVLLSVACGDRAPARLVVDVDTLLLNGPGRIAIPARVVSHTGRTLERPAIVAESRSPDVVSTATGAVQCLRSGDASVSLAAGSLRGEMVVQCRRIRSFAPPFYNLDLFVGGPPLDIPVVAYGEDGQPISRLRYAVSVRDTAVVAIERGQIRPRRVGRTTVHLDFGGISTWVGAEVVGPVHLDTLHLAPGEYRTWPLDAGRYRISVHRLDGRGEGTGSELRTDRANCARDSHQAETIHCVVAESGTVLLRAPERRVVPFVVRIVRTPG